MSSTISSRHVVRLSLVVDVLDVVTCLAVAWATASAIVFAEMAQGMADVAGSLLLVVGERRARRPPDSEHPLGYQREVFFWALLSAVLMLVLGAGLSFARGLDALAHPEALRLPWLALGVLALSVVTNGYSVRQEIRHLVDAEGSLRQALYASGRTLVQTALLRDVVGTLSAVLGLVALTIGLWADAPVLDAVGALVVAVLLSVFSVVLIARARALISGRSVPDADLDAIREVAASMPGVVAVNRLAAVHAGSRDILVDLDLDLDDRLTTGGIEELLDDLLRRVRKAVPEVASLRVDLNSPGLDDSPPDSRRLP